MTYLEALYGSQYYELTNKGRNGDAGRLNGNLFLSAFVIVCIFLIVTLLLSISTDLSHQANNLLHKVFGYSSGKTVGRLLAIPLMGIIYYVISKTVGSASNYARLTQSFMTYSDEEKQKANAKILKPFFIVLGLLLVLMLAGLV